MYVWSNQALLYPHLTHHRLSTAAKVYALGVLSRLAADTELTLHHGEVQSVLQESFAALVNDVPGEPEGEESVSMSPSPTMT